MLAEEAYALSKNFTKKTVIGLGAIKGANCTIKSTEHVDGQTIVIFEWTSTDGSETKQTTEIRVNDGTPIYVYEPGHHYLYGDLVIYEAQWFRCTTEHTAGEALDPTKFEEIGSPDGNFDIVASSEDLPPRFTSADRKMYYSIADTAFWLWNGTEWELQERSITNDEIDALFA
jgi:hypothetical protein